MTQVLIDVPHKMLIEILKREPHQHFEVSLLKLVQAGLEVGEDVIKEVDMEANELDYLEEAIVQYIQNLKPGTKFTLSWLVDRVSLFNGKKGRPRMSTDSLKKLGRRISLTSFEPDSTFTKVENDPSAVYVRKANGDEV